MKQLLIPLLCYMAYVTEYLTHLSPQFPIAAVHGMYLTDCEGKGQDLGCFAGACFSTVIFKIHSRNISP